MVPRFPLVLPLLLLLASPVLGAIRSTPERELTGRQLDLAPYSQFDARIASDGVSFLAVWWDAAQILGTRLAPNGAVLDSTPLDVGGDASLKSKPALAWGTDRYLAVWQSDRIRGRFIAPDGSMSDVIDVAPLSTPSVYDDMFVAFNGRVFLVLWFDSGHYGAIVDLNGRVLVTRELATNRYAVDIVARDGTFYLASASDAGITLLPFDEQLRAGAPIVVATRIAVTSLHATAREGEIIVGWTESLLTARRRIRSAHVTRDGVVRDGVTIEDQILHLMDVAANHLLYTDYKRLLARPHGSADSIELAAPAGATLLEDSASSSLRTVAAIFHRGDFYTTIVGEDEIAPLTLTPRHQEFPDAAAAGDVTLAVWAEHRNLQERLAVVATRIDANGIALDWQPIDTGGSVPPNSRPRVASNGSEWLIVWLEDLKIFGVRVARDGTLLDSSPILIATQTFPIDPAVAWDGTGWMVVFTRGYHQREIRTVVWAARVSAQGVPSPAVELSGTAWNWQLAVASSPEGSLIVWSEFETLRGAMLLRNGVVMPVAFTGKGRRPAVAWNGDTFLVATAVEFGLRELRWLRVDAHGNVRESPTSIALDRGQQTTEQAAGYVSLDLEAVGSGFLLVWNDRIADVSAAILDGQGNLIDGPAPAGKTMPGYYTNVAAAGTRLVTSRPIGHPSRLASRVFTQTIEWTPQSTRRTRAVR